MLLSRAFISDFTWCLKVLIGEENKNVYFSLNKPSGSNRFQYESYLSTPCLLKICLSTLQRAKSE